MGETLIGCVQSVSVASAAEIADILLPSFATQPGCCRCLFVATTLAAAAAAAAEAEAAWPVVGSDAP